MKPEHLEPLISRYVDGEVTEAEKTLAEAMIASDMFAKQVWLDYMGIRHTFVRATANLPKLPANFAATILSTLDESPATAAIVRSRSVFTTRAATAGPRSTVPSKWSVATTMAENFVQLRRWWIPLATTTTVILLGVAAWVANLSPKENNPSSQLASLQTTQTVQMSSDETDGDTGFRMVPPPMPGTETVTTVMTPDDMVKKSQDQLLTRGVEFVCSPPKRTDSSPRVSPSMSFVSVFETRMLIILSDKEIPWQKSSRGNTASVSYELTVPLAELTVLLAELQAEAEKCGWNIEPATDSLNPIVAQMTELPRTVKIRLRFSE